MLEGFRKLSQNWVGRMLLTVVLGFIVASFVIWGMGDPFRSAVTTRIASVGGHDIGVSAFRAAFEARLNELNVQNHQSITAKDAHLYGIDSQVLNQMLNEATLDARADSLGLAVGDEALRAALFNDPAFKGPTGAFDRFTFQSRLRDAGLTEAGFVSAQRAQLRRRQLAQALGGYMKAPRPLLAAIHHYQNDTRSIEAFVLITPADATPPAIDPDKLKAFFDERKTAWRAPEYRKIAVLTLNPQDVANAASVSDEDAKKRYDANQASYVTPEQRQVLQIVFKSQDEAKEAAQKINAGQSFEEIAKARGLSDKDIDLGLVTKSAIADKAASEAAFSLKEGAVSAPIEGQFGWLLMKVTTIKPDVLTSFDSVKDKLKSTIALEKAGETIKALRDKIEDQRASGKALVEIAKDVDQNILTLDFIDASGFAKPDSAGKKSPIDVPNKQSLLRAAFASDIGVDNDVLGLSNGGYQWFELASIEQAHERALNEVEDEVKADYLRDQRTQKLAEDATNLLIRLNKGEALTVLAQEKQAAVVSFDGMKRSERGKLPAGVVAQIFTVPVKGNGSASYQDGRLIFQVRDSQTPPFDYNSEDAKTLQTRLADAMADDVLRQYIGRWQRQLGTTIDQNALALASGTQDLE